jgi:hypothetical protein
MNLSILPVLAPQTGKSYSIAIKMACSQHKKKKRMGCEEFLKNMTGGLG